MSSFPSLPSVIGACLLLPGLACPGSGGQADATPGTDVPATDVVEGPVLDTSSPACSPADCDDGDPGTYDFCHVATLTCIHNRIDYAHSSQTVDGHPYTWFVGHTWKPGVFGKKGKENVDYAPGPDWMTRLIWGTDLGLSAEFLGRTWFVFGDTWSLGSPAEPGKIAFPCDPGCTGANCPQCNDSLAIADDDDPSDGITISEIPFEEAPDGSGPRFLPIRIPGVHSDVHDATIWGSAFNVPSGLLAFESSGKPGMFLWYATGKKEENGVIARSWLATTADGLTFRNCLADDRGTPDTSDDLYHPFSTGPGSLGKGRFMNVGAVEIDPASLAGCGAPADPGTRGVLMIGSALPYRRGDVYLAYAPLDRLCSVRCLGSDCGHAWVKYYSGKEHGCWSDTEADAIGLLGDQLATGGIPQPGQSIGIGELSVKPLPGLGFVMLSNETVCPKTGGPCTDPKAFESVVHARFAPAATPWKWSSPVVTGARGYGPHVVHRYTKVDGKKLILWHLSSTWLGVGDGGEALLSPYGVQSTKSEIVLPVR